MNCNYCGVHLDERRGRRNGKGIVKCKSKTCRATYQREYYRKHHRPKPKKLFTQRELNILINKQWVRDEMFTRGKCAYHMQYFGIDLPVHVDYIEVFEFDHVNRALKRGREFMVSRLISRAPLSVVQREVELCELVCSNCHQIKTRRNKDWTPSGQVIQEHPQLTFE